jgi:PAS domain S-box-containing protein
MKLLLLFFGVVFYAYGADAFSPVTLQLQWKHQFQFAGYYIAKEKGFYREAGLDVTIHEYSDGIDPVEDVSTGKTAFATGRSSLILEQDKDILLLAAIFQSSPFVLQAVDNGTIHSLKDIKNKKVMVSSSLADLASITAMLKLEGITEYDFQAVKHSYNPQDLIDGNVDFMSSYISNEPFILSERGISSVIFDPRDYGFDFYGDILFTSKAYAKAHPEIVEKFYRATLQGWKYAFNHISETANLIYRKYNTQHKSKRALRYEGKVLKKLAFREGVPFGKIEPVRLREIANTYRLLGIESGLQKEYSDMVYQPSSDYMIALDKQEKSFLKKHEKLTLCVKSDWIPLEEVKEGKYIGMGDDLLDEIEKMGIPPFKIKAIPDVTEGIFKLRNGGCDMLSMVPHKISLSQEHNSTLNVTDHVFSFPLVIATQRDEPYITTMKSLLHQKIAVLKGYGFKKRVEKYGLVSDVVEVENAAKGLEMVDRGEVYGYIDILPSVNYMIQKLYIGNLKINRSIDDEVRFGFGVSKKYPELYSILQKAIHAIDLETREEIVREWMHNEMPEENILKRVWKWLVVIGIVQLLFLYHYHLSIQKNKALQLSLKELSTMMESMIEGILIFDKDGICLRTNKVASRLFGYTHGEMVGKHASEFVSSHSKEMVREKMKVDDQAPYEGKVLRKDGTEFDGLLRGKNIRWKGEQIRVSTVIDISEMKQLQYDLEMLNSNLEEKVRQQVEDMRYKDRIMLQQSKLASMGEMIGAIAHQWRQPLNILNINIQNLDDDFEDGLIDRKFVDEFIEENSKIIRFMSKTIDDFRNFYRIDKVKECFFVKEAIEMTTSIHKAQLQHHKINFSITGEDFCITGYKREFQQVILNLVNNASDAIRRRRRDGGMIEIILDKESVTVKDNGGGIDSELIDRIFEPYFTTKVQGEGTGIGLYIAKVIIEKNMGGKLDVVNVEDGAAFKITLEGACRLYNAKNGTRNQKKCMLEHVSEDAALLV